VTADIDLRDGGGVRVSTVSGDVAVRLPACASARVDLRSTSGRLHSGFDGLSRSPGPGPAAMSATIGSGSANLSVTSMTGDVTLLARPEPAAADQPAPGQARSPEQAADPDHESAAEPAAATTEGLGDAR
jgi:hypothetical protein